MWRQLQVDDGYYLVKHEIKNTIYNLSITDLVQLWQEDIDTKSIVERCRKMNPLLEADDIIFIEHIFQLVYDNETQKKLKFVAGDAAVSLELNSSLEGIKFQFKFNLLPCNAKAMFQDVTAVMFLKLQNLINGQRQLVDIIQRKDVEIEQYKVEGAVLSHKLVETQKFDEDEFKSQYLVKSWPTNITDSYGEIIENSSHINKIIEKNLEIVLDINQHSVTSEPRTPEKNKIQLFSQKNSRKRTYIKNISPSKLVYGTQGDDDQEIETPSTSVKLEENIKAEIKKRKAIRTLLR